MFGIIRSTTRRLALATALTLIVGGARASDSGARDPLDDLVDSVIAPVMAENMIPGMAIGIIVDGERHFFNYGVSSPDNDRPVTPDTIFEIGSVSKTFTATLAAYAQVTGRLSFSDVAASLMPELAGSPIGEASLMALGTYSAGGLPLQFPDAVSDDGEMVAFYRDWRPIHPAGTQRLYSNPSIGLFGYLTAKRMGAEFKDLVEDTLLPGLGLNRTFVTVPQGLMDDYAWGLSKAGQKVRVSPGILDAEAYGIKTSSSDLLRFVELHVDGTGLGDDWRRALQTTRKGQFSVGPMVQALGWELYAYPTSLDDLLQGNSSTTAMEPNRIAPAPTLPPAVLVNKTGSTNGFGTYAAFVPSEGIGIVMLANRNFPIPARIAAAHAILSQLD